MSFGLSPMCQYYFYPRPPRGGRLRGVRGAARRTEISIHALREEGDSACVSLSVGGSKFLSTPSARRATRNRRNVSNAHQYFYPRPPRGGRRNLSCVARQELKFLSTPSARRATSKPNLHRQNKRISIHALREEGDRQSCKAYTTTLNFYPRPPRGGRQSRCNPLDFARYFYPRPPRGGRLGLCEFIGWRKQISIHALREEGDQR